MKPAIEMTTSRRGAQWMIVVLVLSMAVPSFGQSSSQIPSKRSVPRRVRRVVVVSIPDRKLAVLENGNVLAYFPVAVGAAVSPSPTGEFEIVNRVANPTYYHDGVMTVAGADNPVGTRWMGFNLKGYGIHGTNAPRSVGHATSHGCIRLINRDVEKLYAMLRIGDTVQIHGERDEEIASVFGGTVDATQVLAEAVGQ